MLKGKREVISLEFLKNEYPGETHEEGGVVASRLITEQAPHGNRRQWAYALKDVYVIALLEKFTISAENNEKWLHDVALLNTDTGKIFNERLRFTYIELLSFNKREDQLESELEKWVYALKNLKHLKQAPTTFTEPQLLQFCQAARYINLTKEEKNMISTKTKNRWDYHNVIDGAKIQGQELGRAEGAHETAVKVATNLKEMALSNEKIAKATGLSIEEINKL